MRQCLQSGFVSDTVILQVYTLYSRRYGSKTVVQDLYGAICKVVRQVCVSNAEVMAAKLLCSICVLGCDGIH